MQKSNEMKHHHHVISQSGIMNPVIILLWVFLFLPMGKISLYANELRFTVIHTSDEHSNLLPLPLSDHHESKPNPALGGFARLGGLIQQTRDKKGEESLLVLSSGDFIGGSPFAWLILEGYAPEIRLMKEIGYHGLTIGNHEFDYGPEILASYLEKAGYPSAKDRLPLLASNLVIPPAHPLQAAGLKKYQQIKLDNGLNIGLIGLLGTTAFSLAPLAEPVSIVDPVEAAREQVEILKEKGADVIIALTHSGYREDLELANAVDGIDILLGGHDHYLTPHPETHNGTIVVHSGKYLESAGMFEFSYNTDTSVLKLENENNQTPYHIRLDHTIPKCENIAALVENYGKKLNAFLDDFTDGLIGDYEKTLMLSGFPLKSGKRFQETSVGNFLTDAMRYTAEEVTGSPVDIAFQANGMIRGDIIPGSMEWSEGAVTFLDLASVAGLGSGPDQRPGYPMVSFYLNAAEVKNFLEIASLLPRFLGDNYFLQFSGLKYTIDPGKVFWLTVPFINQPVPAYRSVQEIKLFSGMDPGQATDFHIPNPQDEETLYHLVSDHYLTSFLPMVGELLPRLQLELKDKQGNPLQIDETIIRQNERELKVWEALTRYAMSFDPDENGVPVLPESYKTTQGRIIEEAGIPLAVWSYTLLVVLLAGIFLLVRRLLRAGKKH